MIKRTKTILNINTSMAAPCRLFESRLLSINTLLCHIFPWKLMSMFSFTIITFFDLAILQEVSGSVSKYTHVPLSSNHKSQSVVQQAFTAKSCKKCLKFDKSSSLCCWKPNKQIHNIFSNFDLKLYDFIDYIKSILERQFFKKIHYNGF